MADNVQLNLGTGGEIAASDDIGGVQYQRVKLVLGANGVNDGDVSSANPIPGTISKIATSFSTTSTPLAGGASWTSSTYTVENLGNGLIFFAIADQSGTVYLEESLDNTNWTTTAQSTYIANYPFAEQHVAHSKYFRVKFINGATPQTSFRASLGQIPFAIPWMIKLDPNMSSVTQGGGAWAVDGAYEENVSTATADGILTLNAVANASAPTKTEGKLVALSTDLAGNLRTVNVHTSTAALTNVAYSSSTGTIVASNTSRNGCIIYNDSDRDLYIKYGTTASTSSFTYKIPSYGHWEMNNASTYTGQIDGLWASGGSGNARITDMSHN